MKTKLLGSLKKVGTYKTEGVWMIVCECGFRTPVLDYEIPGFLKKREIDADIDVNKIKFKTCPSCCPDQKKIYEINL